MPKVIEEVVPEVENTTDKYFNLSKTALQSLGKNPRVTYRFFMRTDVIVISKFVKEYLKKNLEDGKYEFRELIPEGQIAKAKVPFFELSGRIWDLIEHETALLWYIGWPSLSSFNAKMIRSIVPPDIQIIDMAARHCPGEAAVRMASYAAHIAGFDACSTKLGADTFGGEPVGSMPHVFIGAFDSTVDAAVAYYRAHSENPISVLVDYYAKEQEDSVACWKELGSNLKAVRIDTHGARYCQGVVNTEEEGEYTALSRVANEFKVSQAGIYKDYMIGKGVTVEASYVLRKTLDEAGAKKVGILVSSGFDYDKVAAFMQCQAPIDAIGTGSFLPLNIKDTYATADVISYDGRKKIKVGREWLL